MSDHNRKYKRIVRVSDEADAKIRSYAAEHSLSASEAAIALVMRAVDPAPAVQVPSAPSLVLPDDLEERLVKLAQRRKKTLEQIKVYALTVAAGRLEAVDRHEDGKKARAS